MSNVGDRYKFKAVITNKRWYSNESNWGIFDFTTEDNIVCPLLEEDFFSNKKKSGSIIGQVQELSLGEEYVLEVEVEFSKKYKKNQLKPIRAVKELPTTLDQQERFLKSILSPKQATTLLSKYPNIVHDIIENKEIDVSVLDGIGKPMLMQIKNKVLENYVLIDLLSTLSPYGVTFNQIKKIATMNENPMLINEMIQANPYVLTKIKGFGFKKVDGIALKLNPSLKKSEQRTTEYLRYILEETGESIGHTWVERNFIISKARKDIPECMDIIKAIIDEEAINETFLKVDGNKIGLLLNYRIEKAIARHLERINNAESSINIKKVTDEVISELQDNQGFDFSEEQLSTLKMLNDDGNIMVISGSAGSGKSTILKALTDIVLESESKTGKNPSIIQMALSAKASQRIKEVTKRPAMTIHRALGFMDGKFMRDETNPLPYDIIVIDELSMVNIGIFLSVLKAVRSDSLLVLVFDHAQLQPLGEGAISYDILEYSNYKKSKYTQVHRQGQDSGILIDANKVRKQKNPVLKYEASITTGKLKDMTYFFRSKAEELNELAIKLFMSGVDRYGVDNINIVTARKDKVLNSAEELNKKIQELINPRQEGKYMENMSKTLELRVEDRVMQIENNYDKKIFNGEVGVVIGLDREYTDKMVDVLVVDYGVEYGIDENGDETCEKKIIKYHREELGQLRNSWASTVHKFQGSENKAIIVLLDQSSYMLLDSTMLYTAMTRAKERCVLISDTNSFKQCINTNKVTTRNTYLKELLQNKVEGVCV